MEKSLEKREMICTACPTGCRLTVFNNEGEVKVEGNRCPRGVRYGRTEFIHPVRMVTTLVRVKGGERRVVSCRTTAPVLKEEIPIVLEIAKHIIISAPVVEGDLIAENVTKNVNLIATANCGLRHK